MSPDGGSGIGTVILQEHDTVVDSESDLGSDLGHFLHFEEFSILFSAGKLNC